MAADLINKYAVALLCALCAQAAGADPLTDPTRPPAGIVEGSGGEGGGGATLRMAPSMKGLTSVIMSDGRCAAIIDGKTVRLGELHDGARLVEITPGAVVLESGSSKRTLQLFQGIGVKPSSDGSAPLRQAAACRLDGVAATGTQANKHKVRKAPATVGQEEKK